MKCSIKGCPGEYKPSVITHPLRQDGRVAVIDHVPAEGCSVCGDTLLQPKTIRQLEALLKRAQPASSVPLYEYA